jgi:TfoX/Sxy family transcriptional regulator of competence genes
MAFDEKLAERMRKQLAGQSRVAEKRMFGGVAFLLNGNMCCGVHKQAMLVRVAPQDTEAALRRPHTRLFDLTGRPMKGWVLVEAEGVKTAASLRRWVDQGVAYAASLPAKK